MMNEREIGNYSEKQVSDLLKSEGYQVVTEGSTEAQTSSNDLTVITRKGRKVKVSVKTAFHNDKPYASFKIRVGQFSLDRDDNIVWKTSHNDVEDILKETFDFEAVVDNRDAIVYWITTKHLKNYLKKKLPSTDQPFRDVVEKEREEVVKKISINRLYSPLYYKKDNIGCTLYIMKNEDLDYSKGDYSVMLALPLKADNLGSRISYLNRSDNSDN